MKSFKGLIVWQKAMDLVEMVYRTTGGFPTEELYGLSAQIRRAALVVDEDTALGTAAWVCSAQSTIVGGPRPIGQVGFDSDAATFEVFESSSPLRVNAGDATIPQL